jgi:hypothetical protein
MWWPETGSNRRRRPFQGRALPLSYLALAWRTPVSGSQVKPVREREEFRARSGNRGSKRQAKYSNPVGHRQTAQAARRDMLSVCL